MYCKSTPCTVVCQKGSVGLKWHHSETIKSAALATVKLCLSEGVRQVNYHCNLSQATLKTFLGLHTYSVPINTSKTLWRYCNIFGQKVLYTVLLYCISYCITQLLYKNTQTVNYPSYHCNLQTVNHKSQTVNYLSYHCNYYYLLQTLACSGNKAGIRTYGNQSNTEN